MTDRDLNEAEWEFVCSCLEVIANSNPEGPTEWEAERYQDLLDMGFTEQWIAENMWC